MTKLLDSWKSVRLMLLALVFFLPSVFFVVQEGSVAMVVRLGQLKTAQKGVIIYGPGLHMKSPWVDQKVVIDRRLQTLDVPSSRVLTEEQKAVDVDYYVKWRVADPGLYYRRTAGDGMVAKNILLRKVNDLLRANFGDKHLRDVIADHRQDAMQKITEATQKSSQDIGIEVVDVRIRRIDYPKEVTQSVYQRMTTQREQVAKMYRANGQMRGVQIQAESDREANIIKADAALEADRIRARGDQEAARISNQAYQSNPRFYKFWRMLRAYEKGLKEKTFWILDPKKDQMDGLLSVEKEAGA